MDDSGLFQAFIMGISVAAVFCLLCVSGMAIFILYLSKNKKSLLRSGKKMTSDFEELKIMSWRSIKTSCLKVTG
jgi:hypothetical protein